MDSYLAYIISKYPLNFLILGFVLGLIAYTRSPKGPAALAHSDGTPRNFFLSPLDLTTIL